MIHDSETKPSEIMDIIEALGRTATEGNVKGDNLGRVLLYLQQTKTEEWKKTINRLAIRIGIHARYVKENYLNGIADEGIIELCTVEHKIFWRWIGIKAFKRKNNGDGN